jgi:Crinkler effector protein N-terminal domain
MATHLKVFVYILGLKTSSFPVTVERSETVGHLKEAILKKKPNQLKDLDADQLILYQVELPDDENLEQSSLQAPKRRLDPPSRVLSRIFPQSPPEETISILIDMNDLGE